PLFQNENLSPLRDQASMSFSQSPGQFPAIGLGYSGSILLVAISYRMYSLPLKKNAFPLFQTTAVLMPAAKVAGNPGQFPWMALGYPESALSVAKSYRMYCDPLKK